MDFEPDAPLQPLPFTFLPLEGDRYVAVNLAGEHLVLERATIEQVVNGTIRSTHPRFSELRRLHFVMKSPGDAAFELLALKYRSKKARLADFTGLHMFVTTLRCEHSCPYCQVSRVSKERRRFDMTIETANRAVDLMFRSPNPALKVEFQGGESLLNWEIIEHIVETCEDRNRAENRALSFVIATNLALVTDEQLRYCGEHDILISTSLDGPADLHNKNRPRPGGNSHALAISGIERARRVLGRDRVSALMTTTRESLSKPREIVDEYVRNGFYSIFLRALSPFGFAVKTSGTIGYTIEEFLEFYDEALAYIIDLNDQGVPIVEEYARLLLTRLMTPQDTGYVDLMSPAGTGLAAVVYGYDGRVYASDEARMLAATGDDTFCLGTVDQEYESLFGNRKLLDVIYNSMVEAVPGCADCAFQLVCGTDPVYHHATQGDFVGHRPTSGFCKRNMHIFKYLIRLWEDDPRARRVFEHWLWGRTC